MRLRLAVLAFCAAVCVSVCNAEKKYYDTYTGSVISTEQYQSYLQAGNDGYCTVQAEDCDPNEGRRLDGTCNNLKHPSKGATMTPYTRMLPPNYDGVDGLRMAKSGNELPNPRKVRTHLIAEGKVPDSTFTNLVPLYWVYMATDNTAPQDISNYIFAKPSCCSAEGKNINKCQQIAIPHDDPVFRWSPYRCMNLTTPLSYQNVGCLANGTAPQRINAATPALDVSTPYGSVLALSLKARTYEGGLLKTEEEEGRIWPPSLKENPSDLCVQNHGPREVRCHDVPSPTANSLLAANLHTIWFWRYHNFIAKELAEVNPCWDDEKLFYTARDINIAVSNQIYYYEFYASLFGKENLIRDGVILNSQGFRDIYNDTTVPQQSIEYTYGIRWGHKTQEGTMKLFDVDGTFLKTFPIVNATYRTGYLAIDNNIDYITQGLVRQPAAKFDDQIVDPDLGSNTFGEIMINGDAMALDNLKGRYFGLQPYIKYRELCSGKTYSSFDDLLDYINPDLIELLKELYESVGDIDLMAGMWLENNMEGASVPPTLYCIVTDQLRRSIVTDRHWYERAERPKAFTDEQLKEIRKATMSLVLCSVGDKITEIQPNAFKLPEAGNERGPCSKTTNPINFTVWKDETCSDDNADVLPPIHHVMNE